MQKHTHKLLIVDDEQDIRELLRRMLEIAGYDVIEADRGESALYALAKTQGVEMVLLDWMMPQMSGLDVLTQLRETFPDLPVLMLSARAEQEDIIRALEFGANDYLLKPVDRDTLLLKISSLFNEERESRRIRVGHRKNVNFPASTNLLVTAISRTGVRLESNYPMASGDPFIMACDSLAMMLDVKHETRFACRVIECQQQGRKFLIKAIFLNIKPEMVTKIEHATQAQKDSR